MSERTNQLGGGGEPLGDGSFRTPEVQTSEQSARPDPAGHPSTATPPFEAGGAPWGLDQESERQSKQASHRRHVRIEIAAAAVLVAAAVGALIGYAVSSPSSTTLSAPTTTTVPSSHSTASGAPSNAADLAAATDPALVDINVTDSYQAVQGAATGMVLTSNGGVLTNNHVVEEATSISVVDVGNRQTYGATVVGYDPSQDVAVLRLSSASGLHTVGLGDSSTVKVSNGVVVVGNAEGTGGTPSYAGGSVTALDQSITAQDQVSGASEQLSGLIETNADVIPGDSGGAMVNGAGRVIGMTTAASESYQFQPSSAQGFAIPINQALAVARQIEAGQASSTVHIGPTAFLGVLTRSPFFGITGAEIAEVLPSSGAAQAGLTAGDVINSINGQAVTSPESLSDLLLSEAPGASVQIGYLDLSGQQQSVTVTLGTGPAQ
ncbi:MAG TPA: trypsin-like peptidase domain-containing protein [Acidimicrobiales bacterium]|nr:trypsin-like peptidase domain-containing protein [Acidimicrobiales bacterium]